MKEKENKDKIIGKDIYIFLFLFVLLIAGLSTLSFAFYRQYKTSGGSINSNNTIITGDVLFAYSDANSGGNGGSGGITPANGIQITNAAPLSDELGKITMQDKSYFDFQIIASPSKGSIDYQVLLQKIDGSNLSESDVKVYVTEVEGPEEIAILETLNYGSVKVYSQFENATNEEVEGKVLFQRTISDKNYQKNYRLRMWLRDNAKDYYNKRFSAKVNVFAFTSSK